jgi:hypothetical protein
MSESNVCYVCQRPSNQLVHPACAKYVRPQDRGVTRHAVKASLMPSKYDGFYGFTENTDMK